MESKLLNYNGIHRAGCPREKVQTTTSFSFRQFVIFPPAYVRRPDLKELARIGAGLRCKHASGPERGIADQSGSYTNSLELE
jgi:hypothetical protein